MRSHSHGGVVCEHGTKKACLAARRLAMGKCQMVLDKREYEMCSNWATDTIGDRKVCGQHFPSITNRLIAARNRQIATDRMAKEIHHYMAWSGEFPSLWDKFPNDWRERLPN